MRPSISAMVGMPKGSSSPARSATTARSPSSTVTVAAMVRSSSSMTWTLSLKRITPSTGPTWKTQPLGVGWSQGERVSPRVPKTARMRNVTVPETPSSRRASSHQGRRPARLLLRDSVTRAVPVAVVKTVSSTLLSVR